MCLTWVGNNDTIKPTDGPYTHDPSTYAGAALAIYNSHNHADRPASCIRRVIIEIAGIIIASKYNTTNAPDNHVNNAVVP